MFFKLGLTERPCVTTGGAFFDGVAFEVELERLEAMLRLQS